MDCPEGGRQPRKGRAAMNDVRAWFIREVLPFEPVLMRYLRRNWRRREDIADLRNDIYVSIYESALKQIPEKPRQFVISAARNLLIDRFRREHIVPIEAMADLDALEAALETADPERTLAARDELRRLQRALDQLPPRAREVIIMRRVEGLSRAEIAQRLGISEETISAYVTSGMRTLTELFFGESTDFGAKP
jgi:RNA polymerase sigma-70 factor (ECF subfamily)